MSFGKKEDRIGIYLIPRLRDYIFDELSDEYLDRAGIADILMGIPIPVKKTGSATISTLEIARGMAFVFGCDPEFAYGDNYMKYIRRIFGDKFAEGLLQDGINGIQRGDFIYGCIQFRAAIQLDPERADGWYCYGRACQQAYEQGGDETFVGRFKAESLEAFELTTMKDPAFADGYYFLGYSYVNLGLYVKAKLTWEEFMKLSQDEEKRKEIEERLTMLKEPVEIEKGYNLVLSGHYQQGIEKLKGYREGQFSHWWPLWYYLGIAYEQLGMEEDAERHFLEVLKLSPSNLETMEELVKIYQKLGEEDKAEKYRTKIQVVKNNAALDKAEMEAAASSPSEMLN